MGKDERAGEITRGKWVGRREKRFFRRLSSNLGRSLSPSDLSPLRCPEHCHPYWQGTPCVGSLTSRLGPDSPSLPPCVLPCFFSARYYATPFFLLPNPTVRSLTVVPPFSGRSPFPSLSFFLFVRCNFFFLPFPDSCVRAVAVLFFGQITAALPPRARPRSAAASR